MTYGYCIIVRENLIIRDQLAHKYFPFGKHKTQARFDDDFL